VIKSFADKETEKIWDGIQSRKLPNEIQNVARRKLRMINNAQNVVDLRIPPANHLEKLSGNLSEFYSIRINNQWRIIFKWQNDTAFEVQIVDCRLSLKIKVMANLKNIHPGEVLKEEFLEPLGITAYRLSKETFIPQTRVSEILKGNRRITADTALRLSRYFGTSAKFWLGLQDDYDLEEENISKKETFENIKPIENNAA
jgi:addiction module HigA family antidote